MKYPNCGMDSEVFLQVRAKAQKRVEKEEEFERMYGEQLRPTRRKQAWICRLGWGLIMFAVYSSSLIVITWAGGLELKISDNLWFYLGVLLSGLAFSFLFGFAVAGDEKESKCEKELRKSFGL